MNVKLRVLEVVPMVGDNGGFAGTFHMVADASLSPEEAAALFRAVTKDGVVNVEVKN